MTDTTFETLDAPRGAPPSQGPPVATGTLEPEAAVPFWASVLAAIALLAVFALAFLNDAKPGPADQLTLPVLGILTALFAWTPLRHKIAPQREAATFALCAALFVVYGLSRRIAPESLPAFTLYDEQIQFSCAAWCVFLGALLSIPSWSKSFDGWLRALLCALLVLFIIGLFSFRFVGGYYPASSSTPLNPTVLVRLVMQIIEFAALALCCASVAAHPRTRQMMLMILPVLLFALWARHQFMAAPVESEDEE